LDPIRVGKKSRGFVEVPQQYADVVLL